MYALADCNNFFASCERVFRPDLQGRPVLVLSGNDGCVISRSNETKRIGIKMGASLFEIKDVVSKFDIQCFSSNFSLYGDLSARVMSLLAAHTPCLEQYSIDEAFLDMSHLSPEQAAVECRSLVREVMQGVGVPISIGIAPTKTLAKVASKYAKQYPAYHGVCIIDTEYKRRKALSTFDIGDVWGIGRRHRSTMAKIGVSTALQLADLPYPRIQQLLHKPGINTWRELNGESCIITSEVPDKQSITRSRTFASGVSDKEILEKCLAEFVAHCASDLRKQHSVCKQIAYFVETSRFRTDAIQHVIYQNLVLAEATNITSLLTEVVLRSFRSQFRPRVPYKRAGVIIMDINSECGVQQDLFQTRDHERDERLQQVLDRVNSQYGKQAVISATQIVNETKGQVIKKEHLSPCYSTNIHDIITLKC